MSLSDPMRHPSAWNVANQPVIAATDVSARALPELLEREVLGWYNAGPNIVELGFGATLAYGLGFPVPVGEKVMMTQYVPNQSIWVVCDTGGTADLRFIEG